MVTMAASEARKKFAETFNRVSYGRERVVIEKHGKPAVALVPVEDLDLLRALEDHIDLADAREALAEGGAVSWDEFKAGLGL